ncbi:MAG: amidohydrolase [Rhodobacteraceae bacterium]|nr:amidohydrolase [Paracoccaceae bacterium]
MPVKNRFAELHAEVAAWRQDIHAHPELMYDTERTSALVAEKLREFGCDEVVEGIGRTGVVGVIRGRSDTRGHAVGLRADMDALPIEEATGVDYASTVSGKMHACGHDGHTAMLLGAAKYLAETRNFDGSVVVIFQPAEEGGAGGKAMCDDGMMDRWNIREVYGMHNVPGLPAGQFGVRKGPMLAAADQFSIELTGLGGHAAKPQETIDTTVMGCHIITALQSIAARNIDPTKEVVVSITSAETSSKAFNVIPQGMTLRGTVRTMSEEVRQTVRRRIFEIAEKTAEAFGGRAVLDYPEGYPVLVNHDQETDFAAEAAAKVAGSVGAAPMVMGGEDFAYMLQERPGSFVIIGNGPSAELHNPHYNFNDEIIPAGCSFFAELVESRMPAA